MVTPDSRDYFYIDRANGSNANTGTSPGSAFQTWDYAMDYIRDNGGFTGRGLRVRHDANRDAPLTASHQATRSVCNFLIESYGPSLPRVDAVLPFPAGETEFIHLNHDCRNFLIRGISFRAPAPSGEASLDGIYAANSYGVSIVNCITESLGDSWLGDQDGSGTSGGYAIVNSAAGNPGVQPVFIDSYSDVVVLGLSVVNNLYSHVLRVGADKNLPAGAKPAMRASVGYCDLDANYALLAADNEDRHPLKAYLAFVYAYNSYLRNGLTKVEPGKATNGYYNQRVFDACYFKNGKADCLTIENRYGDNLFKKLNKVRVSGCVFELENNYRAHHENEAYLPDHGFSAVQVLNQLDMAEIAVHGSTVLLGDFWSHPLAGRQAILRFERVSTGLLTDLSIHNVVIADNASGRPTDFNGPFALIPPNTGNLFFKGNCWPQFADNKQPYFVGLHENSAAPKTWAQWFAMYPNDKRESNDRDALIFKNFQPNLADNPVMYTASEVNHQTDYYGYSFRKANGGPSGAAMPCLADYYSDGFVDGIDEEAFYTDYTAGNLDADLNQDGIVDGIDYDIFYNLFEGGC